MNTNTLVLTTKKALFELLQQYRGGTFAVMVSPARIFRGEKTQHEKPTLDFPVLELHFYCATLGDSKEANAWMFQIQVNREITGGGFAITLPPKTAVIGNLPMSWIGNNTKLEEFSNSAFEGALSLISDVHNLKMFKEIERQMAKKPSEPKLVMPDIYSVKSKVAKRMPVIGDRVVWEGDRANIPRCGTIVQLEPNNMWIKWDETEKLQKIIVFMLDEANWWYLDEKKQYQGLVEKAYSDYSQAMTAKKKIA